MTLRQFVAYGLALFAALFVLGALHGCAFLHDQATQAEAAYTAEQLACVDRAATLDESRECRRKVRERWGIAETQTSKQPAVSK